MRQHTEPQGLGRRLEHPLGFGFNVAGRAVTEAHFRRGCRRQSLYEIRRRDLESLSHKLGLQKAS